MTPLPTSFSSLTSSVLLFLGCSAREQQLDHLFPFSKTGGRCQCLSIGQSFRAGGEVSDAFQGDLRPTTRVIYRCVRGLYLQKSPKRCHTHNYAAASRGWKRRNLRTSAPQDITSSKRAVEFQGLENLWRIDSKQQVPPPPIIASPAVPDVRNTCMFFFFFFCLPGNYWFLCMWTRGA